MDKPGGQRWLVFGSVFAYLLIGLEVFIMITPFGLYFYAVYGPLLEALASSPLTAWTTEFFLPHMVFSGDPLITALLYLQVLFIGGLLLFIGAAVPLYYGRLRRRGVVSHGPYRFCRHPQYLFLAISGFGLLLYWPRFLVLISYVTMLFVYYLLARIEEGRMEKEAPQAYADYMKSTPMFFPGEPGGRLFRLCFGSICHRGAALALAYVVALTLAILAAAGLRSYTVARLPQTTSAGRTLVSVYPRGAAELERLSRIALGAPEVAPLLKEGTGVSLVYVMPGDYFLTGLVLAEGPRFAEHKLRRFPELLNWQQQRYKGGVRKFLRLFYRFVDTLGDFRTVYDVDRLIFVRVTDFAGDPTPPGHPLAMGQRRTPALVVDLDSETLEVMAVIPVSGAHAWGNLPMPAF